MTVQALVEKFVQDLTAAIRAETLASIQAALGDAPAKAKRGPKAAAPAKPKLGRKGGKRTEAEMEKFLSAIEASVTKTPGIRADQIAAELGVPASDLALPIKKLLAAKCLAKKGQRRGTTYTVKSAGAWKRV